MAKNILLLCSLAAATVGLAESRTSFSSWTYVIFGDSLSDQGNIFSLIAAPDPTIYYQGRYTNDKNWVDYFQQEISKRSSIQVLNYAYGGGAACAYTKPFPFSIIKDLPDQTNVFLSDVAVNKVPITSSNVVAIQLIGGNDIRNYLGAKLAAQQVPTAAEVAGLVQGIVSCRLAQISSLVQAGVKDIVLMPVGPLWATPYVTNPQAPAGFAEAVKLLVLSIDAAVALGAANAQLELLKTPATWGTRIYTLGFSTWMEGAFSGVTPPFSVTNAACITGITTADFFKPIIDQSPPFAKCSNPNDYLFYDAVHPTTRAHEFFAVQGVIPHLQLLGLVPRYTARRLKALSK